MTVKIINPSNGQELSRTNDELVDQDGVSFPIISGIPRICSPDNYTANFGKQWNRFRRTQIDSNEDGQTLSAFRLFSETAWQADQLAGLDILEVGSGAGRFTRALLEQTCANLYSIDYSAAVEANLENNREFARGRLHLFQASIYEMPFPDESFDKVFCLGVLQHTPSFEGSIRELIRKAKKGAEIVVDFYPVRGWWTKLHAKYLFRPITKRMPHDRLLRLIERNIGWLTAADKWLTRVGLGALTRFLPVVHMSTLPANLPPDLEREWAVLDTFDMFSPEYDNPQPVPAVAEMFRRNGAQVTFAGFVDTRTAQTAVVRAVRV